ncbi:RBBP9/YdeN family alpha/beta hydrolase [Sphingomonas morindae]|uniref:Alpha/beta fold hydrolase n=1 Tax=Sphingomonas morindae TaxID=1541170 RepID=A0ABY4X7S8_9SPHN|nr:alpha/beta fold hydrolase [Sphingomonas morindae]USI72955.1 alpha/beta fold hydrolase [Sphingomonas morindae]
MFQDRLARMPLCLTLPGLDGSGPDHWQSLWEASRPGMERVDLGNWAQPSRNLWISRLERALARAGGPVVLVAHSLSCHLVAWWAHLAGEAACRPVAGALLVAPPDLDRGRIDPRVADFAPTPRSVLPFPAILVASRDDPWCSQARAREMANNWLASFCDAGTGGHLNAASGLGAWPAGQAILDQLLDHVCDRRNRRMDDRLVRERPEAIAVVPA